MRIKKIIPLFSFILVLVSSCVQTRNEDNSNGISWIRFEWEGDTIGGKYYEKLAMFVPFRIEGIPYKFTSQLDLGAPMTMVYGNTFMPLLKNFPNIAGKLDTINTKYVIQGKEVGGLNNISFYLDTVLFKNQKIALFKDYGDTLSSNNIKKDTVIHIGTTGSNLFKGKILAIDFVNNRFAILDSLSNDGENKLIDIIIENGRIKVPVIINGEKVYVLYDTGSSFASLYLSTKNWNKYRDTTSTLDTIMITAWGTRYPLFISKTNIEIKVGNMIFRPKTIMANNLEPYYEFYKREKIIGLMGNQLFYNKILIIDFKNKKFGLTDNRQLTKYLPDV
ncbi:MAG: hypothetical protein GXO86_15580 [Chlorobi bacterium]|nr:hypothetical protein [Chlorobiota bacterium]